MRERKTVDCWEIYVDYGDGFPAEPEVVETGFWQYWLQLRAYRENSGGAIRTKRKRYPKSEVPEWRSIPLEEAKAKVEFLEARLREKPQSVNLQTRLEMARRALSRITKTDSTTTTKV